MWLISIFHSIIQHQLAYHFFELFNLLCEYVHSLALFVLDCFEDLIFMFQALYQLLILIRHPFLFEWVYLLLIHLTPETLELSIFVIQEGLETFHLKLELRDLFVFNWQKEFHVLTLFTLII